MIASTSLRWRARLQKEAINNSDAYNDMANANDSNASFMMFPSSPSSKFNINNNNNNNNLLYSPSKPTLLSSSSSAAALLPMKLDAVLLQLVSIVACCTSVYTLTRIIFTTAIEHHAFFTCFSLILIIVTSLITLHQQYRLEQKGARALPRRIQHLQRRRIQLQQQQQERLYRILTHLDPQVDSMYQTQVKIQRHLSLSSNSRNNAGSKIQQQERLCHLAQTWRIACHNIQLALLQKVQIIIIQTALEINQHLYHHHHTTTTTTTSNNNNKNVPTSSSYAELSISYSQRLLERILLRLSHVPGIDLDKTALRQYWEKQHQQQQQEVRHKDKKDNNDDETTILAWRLVLRLLRRVVVVEGQSQQQYGTAAAARISNHGSDDDDDYTIESCMFRFQPSKLLFLQTAVTSTAAACGTSTTTRLSSQSSNHLHEC